MTATQKQAYLSFRIANDVFAIPVGAVLEVLEMQKITVVPNSSPVIKGVCNFRGDILPVINTALRLKTAQNKPFADMVIIVLDLRSNKRSLRIGALVDSVENVVMLAKKEVHTVPEIGLSFDASFLDGMARIQDRFTMLLSLDRVFAVDELVAFQH